MAIKKKTEAAEHSHVDQDIIAPAKPMNAAIAMTVTPKADEYMARLLPMDSKRMLFEGLPNHIRPEVYERNLFNAITANPWLMNYHPALVFREVSKTAGLGLLLDQLLGEAYLIEAYNYKTKHTEPQLRVGYRGMIKLARQSGNVATVYVRTVYANDKVTTNLGYPPELRIEPINLFSDRGAIIGYAAFITFKDGTFDFEPMSLDACLVIRDRSDAYKAFKAGKIKSTPWSTDEDEMCKKTDFRRLMKRQDQSPQLRIAMQIEDEAEFPHMVHQDRAPQLKAPRPPAPTMDDTAAEVATIEQTADDQPPPDETEVSMNPADTLQWITNRLASVIDPFELPDVWETECLPKLEGAFPPDGEAANAIYDQNEKRLEPK